MPELIGISSSEELDSELESNENISWSTPASAEIAQLMYLVKHTPLGDPELLTYRKSLGTAFRERYIDSSNLNDLEAALQNFQEVADLTPQDHSDRPRHLRNLSVLLTDRYRRLGNLGDLEAALQTDQQAVNLAPVGHPDRAECLQNLAGSFGDRYQRFGNLEDLAAVLRTSREAVDLTPEGHPDRPEYLQSLAISYGDRYQKLGVLEDLETACQKFREVVDLTPKDHPDRAERLRNLSVSFTDRYERSGDLWDLEVAVCSDQEAVQLTPVGHPERPGRLQGLAVSLTDRCERLGALEDLEAALQTMQEAVQLTAEGQLDTASCLTHLATSFTLRYRRFGDLTDLEATLQNIQEAVHLTSEDHPQRAARLRTLAMSFTDRYRRLGNLEDLEAALGTDEEVVRLTPAGHPDKPGRLISLAVSFTDRYERMGNLKDLECALQYKQQAVDLTAEGHQLRARCLRSLAVSFRDRYQRLGYMKDIQTALLIHREAIDLIPQGHPDRAQGLHSVGITLGEHYRNGLGDLKVLEAQLQAMEEAVQLTPADHPDRSRRLQGLAAARIDRYWKLKEPQDLEAVHTHYSNSFEILPLIPQYSWENALQWARFSEECQPSDCIAAYTAAFRLLPELLWIGHSIPVRQDAIHRLNIEQATSNAVRTCIQLSKLDSAVEIMEQGLATTFQQMLQLKTDVDKLPYDQAQKLQSLASQIYGGVSPDSMKIVNARNELLKNIRTQPGLEYFLLPKPYASLCHASQGGPVVILNSHKDCCDGIIVLNPTSGPVHVPFPNVTTESLQAQKKLLEQLLGYCNVRERGESPSTRLFGKCERFSSRDPQDCFEDILLFLWTHIVSPVYEALKSHGIHNGRLWWLSAGAFSGLPLHASPPTDEFIHSYTATLGSLLEGYQKKPSCIEPKIGVVGVSHTGPGGSHPLEGVKKEVETIKSIIRQPLVINCLEGEQATVDAVRTQLQDHSWVHLACHGTQDLRDPTKSHLMLYGGDLQLETILRMPLSKAEFVFLAACQTAMGDRELRNESFHLGGGLIAAGFRGSVGTLWSMNDSDGPLVANSFYSHLFRDGRQPQASDAAESLHFAVRELKQRRKVSYERWIPFVHMGI
ncbi:CHAT domain-containing protein [Mycena crocata]|nr:CHAT domain-containing protein [Mycena crocata]